VDISIDAGQRELLVWSQGRPLRRLAIKGLSGKPMSFEEFVQVMAHKALAEQRRLERARWHAQISLPQPENIR
jgi:hypothetical protein